jgi:hypothetical protein
MVLAAKRLPLRQLALDLVLGLPHETTLVLGLQSITPAYRPLGDHRLESLQKRKDDVEDPLGRPVEVQRASPLKAGG